MSPSTSTIATSGVPTFESLGVRPLINCMGTYTIITGSRALKQVVEAMAEATNHYVHLDELMEAVGQRLAELTGAEWGYIPNGCAAALTELTAACITGGDPEKMARLPDTTGMKNEVIVQARHRNVYDHAVRTTGCRMIEVVTAADVRAAINERTAMLFMVGDRETGADEGIPCREMIAIGHEYGLPCVVDAAAQRPDVPNRYIEMGADAVCYSGGKCLRGPQASGLVLGRKALLQAAFLNAAPHHCIGRPMKCGKEEIMGQLAAVEAWVRGRDHEAEWRMWEGWLDTIREAVSPLPSLRTEIRQPGASNHAPVLHITWDADVLHATPEEVHRELLDGEPRIMTGRSSGGISIMPYMMELGDAEIVARRLREVLSDRPPRPAPVILPPADVAGQWLVRTRYTFGESTHSMTLEQQGAALKGTYRTPFCSAEIAGTINGSQFEFTATLGQRPNRLPYVFRGAVDDQVLNGTVDMGEYGKATWEARRVV